MPDLGNSASDNVGQQAQEQGKELAKKAGQKAGKLKCMIRMKKTSKKSVSPEV